MEDSKKDAYIRPSIHLYFDGACDNSSKLKLMGIGVAVYMGHKSENTLQGNLGYSEMVSAGGTSNQSEYYACIAAMMLALHIKDGKFPELGNDFDFHIFGDSQVIVNQVNREWECRNADLYELRKIVFKLKKHLGESLKGVSWVRRNFNVEADRLSKLALSNYIDNT